MEPYNDWDKGGVWSSIEKGLEEDDKKRRRLVWWLWWSAAMLAVVTVGLTLLLYADSTPVRPDSSYNPATEHSPVTADDQNANATTNQQTEITSITSQYKKKEGHNSSQTNTLAKFNNSNKGTAVYLGKHQDSTGTTGKDRWEDLPSSIAIKKQTNIEDVGKTFEGRQSLSTPLLPRIIQNVSLTNRPMTAVTLAPRVPLLIARERGIFTSLYSTTHVGTGSHSTITGVIPTESYDLSLWNEVGIQKALSENWTLYGGLALEHIWTTYNNTNTTVEDFTATISNGTVYDVNGETYIAEGEVTVSRFTTRNIVNNNSHRRIHVPLGVMYHRNISPRVTFNADMGLLARVRQEVDAVIADVEGRHMLDPTVVSSARYSSSTDIGWRLGVNLGYAATDRLILHTGIARRGDGLYSHTTNNTYFSTWSLSLGIAYSVH